MTKQEQFFNAMKNNDIKNFKLLFHNKNVNLFLKHNPEMLIAIYCRDGNFNIVKFLLKDKRVDPSKDYNGSISLAYRYKYYDIVELLWKDKRVKNTLQKDKLKLYNELILKESKIKISNF